mmetsp:Transcript_22681/g.56166  ORF Transcript_22681/g.56166 Transcript_22681/m.56166 type:complete len:221 (+) Transcript_22681:257-919(+)
MQVLVQNRRLGQNLRVDNSHGTSNEMVPFRLVGVNVLAENGGRQQGSSVALGGNKSKTGISLFLQIVLGLATGSVANAVVDLVDVPIGATGAARVSDRPGQMGKLVVVIRKGQFRQTQILKVFGAFFFFVIILLRIIRFVLVVVVYGNFGGGGLSFVFFDSANRIFADFFALGHIQIGLETLFVVLVFTPIGLWTRLNNMGTVQIEMGIFQQSVVNLFQK